MFQIYSNILYYIAGIISFLKNKKLLGILLYITSMVSCLYHMNKEFWYIDVFISVITFIYGFYLYWKSNNSLVIYPTVAMLAILLYPKKNINIYNQLHPWAHIYGGISSIILALYY